MGNKNITIIGDGGWGTALSIVLAGNGYCPLVWGYDKSYIDEVNELHINYKFLPEIRLDSKIKFTSDIEYAVEYADVIVVVVPTIHLRKVLDKISKCEYKGKLFVSCTKGIENGTYMLPTEIINDELGGIDSVVLSGPSHAEEVARGVPTCVVASSGNREKAVYVQGIFSGPRFRVYTADDVRGVELGGALKNVIAISAGICDGLGYGSNTKAALLSRGLQEITRLGVKLGAGKETFFGLSGMGDLVTTCISTYGRNRFVGEQLGKGKKLDEILESMNMVAEGVNTARSAKELAERSDVDMPITFETYSILFENKDPLASIYDLMMREPKDEIY